MVSSNPVCPGRDRGARLCLRLVVAITLGCAMLSSSINGQRRRASAAQRAAAQRAIPAGLSITANFNKVIQTVPPPGSSAPTLKASLTIRNESTEPIHFTFNSTQQFEIEVSDSRGNVVSRWSEGKFFGMLIVMRDLLPHQSWSFTGEVKLPVKTGNYQVRIFLSADKKPGASSALQIQ